MEQIKAKRLKYEEIFTTMPERVEKLQNESSLFSSGFKILIPPRLINKEPRIIIDKSTRKD